MSVKTYDSKCYDLAQFFCADLNITDHKTIHKLALEIQTTIEDFLDEESCKFALKSGLVR